MTDKQYSLDDIRLRLNELDDHLLALLSERRKLSIEVAKSKVETAKPVRDASREQQLLVKLINNGKDKYEAYEGDVLFDYRTGRLFKKQGTMLVEVTIGEKQTEE